MISTGRRVALPTAMLAALIAAITSVAAAHHGFAVFDTSSQKTITGTVKLFEWTNPHTWVWLDVPNDKGGVDTWGFEGMSPNFLGRRGWTRKTLQPGDKITVTYFGMKDGSKGGAFLSCKLPNGEELKMFGASPTEDN
jgi:Family of unknown function (DUF6152)